MTRDQIISMARESGFSVQSINEPPTPYHHIAGHGDVLERFAALVAAAEREECAKVCEDIKSGLHNPFHQCAAAIGQLFGLLQLATGIVAVTRDQLRRGRLACHKTI